VVHNPEVVREGGRGHGPDRGYRGEAVYNLGNLNVIMPAGLGAIIMLIVALLVNNLSPGRRYPEFWH